MKVSLGNCKTSAQAATKVCYNEKTRNLNFRIRCEDLKDLKKCVYIIDGYNEFDKHKVTLAFDKYASFKKYHPERPDGNEILEFDIGRESSPVIYVKYFAGFDVDFPLYRDGEKIKDFSPKDFKENMKKIAKEALADECQFEKRGLYTVCRLWWD